ncbi:hypothetical protein ABLE92_06610 [Gordonia sp. VNQ95]|uniref:hypothetical protein n=1 Tax=Gordonia sp. VNQ95 TaxID=3156619 RepID=UPI0032B4C85B
MDGYDEPPRQRSPWVIPVIVGVVVGVIVVGAVIVGVKLSRGQWNSVEAESDSGSTTSTVVITETAPATTPTTAETSRPSSTEDLDDSGGGADSGGPDGDDTGTPDLPVPPIADTEWYAQFGAFDDYGGAEAVRDEHYGSLILPGEMVGSSSRYVVARPTRSRGDAEDVCAQFSDGACIVKHRS